MNYKFNLKSRPTTIINFLENKLYVDTTTQEVYSASDYHIWLEDKQNEWLSEYGDGAYDMPSDEAFRDEDGLYCFADFFKYNPKAKIIVQLAEDLDSLSIEVIKE